MELLGSSKGGPIHMPIDIIGAVGAINIGYLFALIYQSQRYERRSIVGNICCGSFNESVVVAALIAIYNIALAIIVRDVWWYLGQELGLSMALLSLSWILRIVCPFYRYSRAELALFQSEVSLLNPRSMLMLTVRVLLSILEVVTVCWLCIDLYVFTHSYKPSADLYHSVRVTAIASSSLLCIGCNIWWSMVGLASPRNNPETLAGLNDRLLSTDTTANELPYNTNELSETKLSFSLLFYWFTPTLTVGYGRLLQLADLPNLPFTLTSKETAFRLSRHCESYDRSKARKNGVLSASNSVSSSDSGDNWVGTKDVTSHNRSARILISILWNCYGSKFVILGVIKLLCCLSAFAGPLVLGAMVSYVEKTASVETLGYGLFLVLTMATSFILSAILNTTNNVRGGVLQIAVKGALTKLLFARAMNLPQYAWMDVDLIDARLTTLVQVDVDRVSDALKSLHDLWALPLQLALAFYLLYDEVRIGFIAGVLLIIVMIPLNTFIAKRINSATSKMMKYKDSRTLILSEAIKGIRSLKMAGLEQAFFRLSTNERYNELTYLAMRKYLDAACVFLWAATPVIVPFATFSTTALLGKHLTAAEVFTALSLLNMLIFPMNAFPWVINGAIEAKVSLMRLAAVFAGAKGEQIAFVYSDYSNQQPTSNNNSTNNSNSQTDYIPSQLRISTSSSSINSSLLLRTRPKPITLLTVSKCIWVWGKDFEWSHINHSIVNRILIDANGGDNLQLEGSPDRSVSLSPSMEAASAEATGISGSKSSASLSSSWTANPIHSSATATAVSDCNLVDNSSSSNNNNNNESIIEQEDLISSDAWVANPMTPMGNNQQQPFAEDSSSANASGEADTETTSLLSPVPANNNSSKRRSSGSMSIPAPLVSPRRPSINSAKSILLNTLSNPFSSPSSATAAAAAGTVVTATAGTSPTQTPSATIPTTALNNPDQQQLQQEQQQKQCSFWLGPVSISAKAGELWAVTGSVASGKTTLLLGLLEEVRSVNGKVTFHEPKNSSSNSTNANSGSNNSKRRSRSDDSLLDHELSSSSGNLTPFVRKTKLGYCAQQPALHSGTIRENILMGLPMNIDKYEAVLRGCCLDIDIMANNMPLRDLTDVGESNGTALSGGQKLRIGVARAIYSDAAIILLDDPFSALDSVTSAKLMSYLYQDVCKKQNRLIILATHSVHLLQAHSDCILVLKSGVICERGSYSDLMQQPTFRALIGGQQFTTNNNNNGNTNSSSSKGIGTSSEPFLSNWSGSSDDAMDCKPTVVASFADRVVEPPINLRAILQDIPNNNSSMNKTDFRVINAYGAENSEERQELEIISSGKINSSVYSSYFDSVGWTLSIIVVVTTLLMQASSSVYAFWLAYWVAHESDFTHVQFVYISAMIVFANMLFAFLRSVLFAYGGLRAAERLYNSLTKSLFNTTLYFYESTSFGKIINRIAKDTNCIDDQLPFIMNILLAQIFLVLGSFAVIAITDPMVIIIIVIVSILYYRLQRFYRQSSRMLRRLDSAYRSPVFTVLCECANNVNSLRAANMIFHYEKQLERYVDDSLRVSMSVNIASQWLGIRLQLLGALIATSLSLSAVLTSAYGALPVSSGLFGLSLSYSFSIVNNLNGLVSSSTETEQEMVSVERVQEYISLENEYEDELAICTRQPQGSNSSSYNSNANSDNNRNNHNSSKTDRNSQYSTESFVNNSFSFSFSDDGKSPQRKKYHELTYATIPELAGDEGEPNIGGEIEFVHVSMRYAPQLPLALQRIDLTIPSGSKVAVVGRTGSGKSSLLRAILRLNEIEGIIKIGGIDITNSANITKSQLRKQLIVIPQEPVLMSGTIRFNLDPCNDNQYTNAQLLEVLQSCGFIWTLTASNWMDIRRAAQSREDSQQQQHKEESSTAKVDYVSNADIDFDIESAYPSPSRDNHGGSFSHWLQRSNTGELGDAGVVSGELLEMVLDWYVPNAGSSLSQGQRQLLSLARAMLPLFFSINRPGQSKIVLIDEATAAVDPAAEAALVGVLSKYFIGTDCTLVMICHRKDGIRRLCNKELKLCDGKVEHFIDVDTL